MGSFHPEISVVIYNPYSSLVTLGPACRGPWKAFLREKGEGVAFQVHMEPSIKDHHPTSSGQQVSTFEGLLGYLLVLEVLQLQAVELFWFTVGRLQSVGVFRIFEDIGGWEFGSAPNPKTVKRSRQLL